MSSNAITDDQWKLMSQNDKMSHIIDRTALIYEYKVTDLTGKKRPNNLSLARHVAMWLCGKKTGASTTEIGFKFGNRSHATVIHAHKNIEKLMKHPCAATETILKLELSLFDRVADMDEWIVRVGEQDYWLIELARSREMTSYDRAAFIVNKYDIKDLEDRAKAIDMVNRMMCVIEGITK